MNSRALMAVVVGLVLVAFGGFYFALKPHANDALLPPPALPPAQTATPSSAAAPPVVVPPPPPPATPASIEAEIALSEHAELQALLKKNFAAEYDELIAVAVRRRNEGVSDQIFGQELAERFEAIMRGKLKYGVGASTPTIDKLAANEASLFHALSTEGAGLCLKMLGKDDAGRRHGDPRKRAATDAARHVVPVPGHRRGDAGGKAGGGSDERRDAGV